MKITDNLTFSESRLLEKADTDAFAWMYQHLPDSYQQQFGFAMENLGNIRIFYLPTTVHDGLRRGVKLFSDRY